METKVNDIESDVSEMLRASALQAVTVLVSLMTSNEQKPELRMKAAESILDRVYGKAPIPLFDENDRGAVISFEGCLEEWSR